MKKISIVTAPYLKEDGRLLIKNQYTVSAVINEFLGRYDVQLILRGEKIDFSLPENCTAIYNTSMPVDADTTFPTYTQKNYFSWQNAELISEEDAEYLICMDAYYPWSLAVCQQIKAKEKILWVNETPQLFLLNEDVPIFSKIYSEFDKIIFSEEKQKESFAQLFPELENTSEIVPYPINEAHYRELASVEWNNPFSTEEINIVMRVSFDTKYPAMSIPKFVMESRKDSERKHYYIFGSGKYKNHFLRDVVIYDVCEEITLVDDDVFYPMLSACDYIMLMPEKNDKEVHHAAIAYGKRLLKTEILENRLISEECVLQESYTQKNIHEII